MNITPYKKKDGRTYYMFHAYIGVDEKTGKEKRVCRRGFDSKKAAQIAYLELTQSDIEKEKERSKMTYRDVYELWLEEHKTQVKESTLKSDKTRFEHHVLPIIGNFLILKITHDDMQKAMNKWASETKRPNKIKTAAGYIFRYAMIHGIIEKNPLELIKTPKNNDGEDEKFENYLDFENLNLFLKTADEILSKDWATFLYLLTFTGLRRGEALALHWDDIDFENRTISVNRNLAKGETGTYISSPKTKTSKRTITIGEVLMNKLMEYQKNAKHNVIVFPNTKGSYTTLSQPGKKVRLVCEKAGIPEISPHGLRHTHCCLLFEAGASIAQVQQRLGHKDVSVTLGIYNHVTKGKEKETALLFDSAFQNTQIPQSKPQSKLKN